MLASVSSRVSSRQVRNASVVRQCNMILLGAPGGGKGTIGKKIINKYDFNHISTGDMLRQHINDQTKLGIKAKEYMDNGKLVPDKLVIDMLRDRVTKEGGNRFLLDGFPRTLDQAASLKEIMSIDAVVVLDIPHETIMQRLSERWLHPASGRVYNLTYNPPKESGKDDMTGEPLMQRDDDKPEVVKDRLETYDKMTSPLIDYYKNNAKCAVSSFKGTESDVIFIDVEKFCEKLKL
jgi:adenylate kinase